MRRTFMLGSFAVLGGSLIAGCGGGGSNNTTLNVASRTVVGYVYVRQNNVPQATPAVIVSSSSVAPAGYAAPTAGTVTMTVPDGTITRAQDTETFNMASGNALVAHVVSRSSGNPSMTLQFTGLQLNGEAKTQAGVSSFDLTGAENTIYTINLNAPSYTAGAPASMRVLVKDPSAMYGSDEQNRFGAPADVIGTGSGDAGLVASSNSADRYEVAVILMDANGVVIPGTTFSVNDTSTDGATESAVVSSGGFIAVNGGGTDGEDVDFTFASPQAPGLTTNFRAVYSYGLTSNFAATFSAPADPASVVWANTPGPSGSTAVNFTVNNGRGVVVPSQNVTLQTRDARTTGTPAVFAGNVYQSPASGAPLSGTSTQTNSSGFAGVSFQAPSAAAGNAAFNGTNIKYGTGVKVDVLIGSTVLGTKVITVTRPLANLNIQGATRLDVNTTSRTTGNFAYAVTGATDIDTQVIAAPVGTYSWTLTPNSAANYGDPDNVSPRSIAAPSVIGSATGSSIQVAAGSSAGRFDVQASFSSTTSNVITTSVIGAPSKVVVSPTPGALGLSGSAGANQVLTLSFLDGFGNDVTSETTITGKNGSLASSPGGSFTFPSAPNRTYNLTFPTAPGSYPASMGVTLNWQGTGQGTTTGSATGLNINRTMNVIVP